MSVSIVSGPEHMASGYTYIIRRHSNGYFKIGSTYNWAGRALGLRMSGVKDFDLIALIPGAYGVEAILHAHFEPHHVGGEWFRPDVRVVDAIRKIAASEFDWSQAPASGWCITKPFQTKASLAHWGPLPRYAELRGAAA